MNRRDWSKTKEMLNWPVFLISGGLLLAFVLFSLFNVSWTSKYVDAGFDLAIRYFYPYWQVLLIATFLVGPTLLFLRVVMWCWVI